MRLRYDTGTAHAWIIPPCCMSEATCTWRWVKWWKEGPYSHMEEERFEPEGVPHCCHFFGEPNCCALHCGPVRAGQSLFEIPTLSFRRALFGMSRLRLEFLSLLLNSGCYWQPRHFYLSLHFLISDNSLSSSSHRSLFCFSKALSTDFPCMSACIRQKSLLYIRC